MGGSVAAMGAAVGLSACSVSFVRAPLHKYVAFCKVSVLTFTALICGFGLTSGCGRGSLNHTGPGS